MLSDAEVASPLSHFDPVELLDVLANVGAQDLLGVGLNQTRGRPVGELFAEAAALTALLRRSLEHAEICAGHEFVLTPVAAAQGLRAAVIVDITVTPLEGQVTGTHLLVELADARQRQRITRENELLSRVDGSRLMVRQLAHEIKNPLG